MDVAKSVLQKLKNKAEKTGVSFQLLLQLFCQEEFLRRLSYSKYQDNLILKGGLFLYLITNFESRPTMDIDFLMKDLSNENEKIAKMIEDITIVNSENEYIYFKVKSVHSITEQKEYHGARIKIIGMIINTRTPFDIDIGVGDVIVPKSSKRKLETQLEDFNKPEVLTYSLESTISEKWDAILDRMEFNSRMKDFYDIYYLANNFDFEGRKLQEAIVETMNNRARRYDKNTLNKVKLLKEDIELVDRWKVFNKNILKLDLSFDKVLEFVVVFMAGPFECIVDEKEHLKNWSKAESEWK